MKAMVILLLLALGACGASSGGRTDRIIIQTDHTYVPNIPQVVAPIPRYDTTPGVATYGRF